MAARGCLRRDAACRVETPMASVDDPGVSLNDASITLSIFAFGVVAIASSGCAQKMEFAKRAGELHFAKPETIILRYGPLY